MSRLEDIKKINQLEVVDHDIDSDHTVIYLNVLNTAENRKFLEDLGATEEDFYTMQGGEDETVEEIDIAYFAFEKLGAEFWSAKKGFYVDWETGLNN